MGALAAGSVVSVPFPLQKISYARPGKLFTANEQLIMVEIGSLKKEALEKVTDAVIEILREGLNTYKS